MRSRGEYSVEFLREVKKKHEGRFRTALEQFEQELRDVTSGNLVIHATSLGGLLAYEKISLDDAELANELALVNGFSDRVGSLTRAPRQLLAYVVEEDQEPTLELAARRFGKTTSEIDHLVDELERAGMARVWFDDEKNRAFITLMGEALDGVIEYWNILRGFTKTKNLRMADLIVDLDFSLLD